MLPEPVNNPNNFISKQTQHVNTVWQILSVNTTRIEFNVEKNLFWIETNIEYQFNSYKSWLEIAGKTFIPGSYFLRFPVACR